MTIHCDQLIFNGENMAFPSVKRTDLLEKYLRETIRIISTTARCCKTRFPHLMTHTQIQILLQKMNWYLHFPYHGKQLILNHP